MDDIEGLIAGCVEVICIVVIQMSLFAQSMFFKPCMGVSLVGGQLSIPCCLDDFLLFSCALSGRILNIV